MELEPTLTRSQRARVLTRARAHWEAGKPHAAWEILSAAGMPDYWPEFLRIALREARTRFTRTMNRR